MSELQDYWNASTAAIPGDKDPSAYALEKEKLFPPQAMVCDLGGGSGADALYFAGRGHDVTLTDISDVALQRAATTATERSLEGLLHTVEYDMDKGAIPLPDASFDVVYSRLALHYFLPDTTVKLFAGVHRILKPGGTAYLTLKSQDDAAEMAYLESTAVAESSGVFSENGHIKARYSLGQLATMLTAAGIPKSEVRLSPYTEKLGGREDQVKSGNTQFLLNEIQISKAA
jgi:ubiquinone/menaquinone biosynthesis C-methylase UbiE